MLDDLHTDISKYILSKYPNEACGIIVDNTFIPITNTSVTPTKQFILSATELLPYLGKIEAIIHSHTKQSDTDEIFDLRTPSYSDIINQRKSKVPWYIYGTDGEVVSEPIRYPAIKSNIYTGRKFIWFVSDCYSLVQDYYLYELGINLPDHKAEDDFKNIRKMKDIFLPYLTEYGFRPTGKDYPEQIGDVIILNQHGYIGNHLAVYIGNNQLIHQDVISKQENIHEVLSNINMVVRYDSNSC